MARTLTRLARLPRRLDDVAVGVAALDAHVGGLVPLLDELDAVCGKTVAQGQDGLAVREADAEVHPPGWRDRLVRRAQRKREPLGVVQHQDAVVVAPRRPGAEP